MNKLELGHIPHPLAPSPTTGEGEKRKTLHSKLIGLMTVLFDLERVSDS